MTGPESQPTASYRPPAPGAETATHHPAGGSDTTAGFPVIPGFRVVRRLGGGGMAEVFEVIDTDLDESFALKIIRPDRADADLRERFRREAKALVGLRHPHIMQFFRFGEADGRPYYVMRLVRGPTLADDLGRYAGDPRRAAELMLTIAEAVAHLHAAGLLHRDLKPSNVLMDEAGPCVSDFGLVKVGDDTDPGPGAAPAPAPDPEEVETRVAPGNPGAAPVLTQAGKVMGTRPYMPPEQVRGEVRRMGPWSDVWSLGVMFYELLAGDRPFRADTDTELERKICEDEPAPLAKAPPAFARIVRKCLRKPPAERYPSARELAEDLRRALRPRARRRWLLAAAALLMIGAGVAVALWPKDKGAPPKPTRAELRERIRAELAAGKTVSLLPEGEYADLWEVVAGKATVERDEEGNWTVETTGTALVELVDDPGVDEFAFEAEMRAKKQSTLPDGGIYAGRVRVADPEGDWHFLIEHWYRESPSNFRDSPTPSNAAPKEFPPDWKVIPPGAVQLDEKKPGARKVYFRGSRYQDRGDFPRLLGEYSVAPDGLQVGGPWRRLAIRAKWEDFSVAWEREGYYHINPQAQKDWLAFTREIFPGKGERPPKALSGRAGLGLFLRGGAVTIRSVRLAAPEMR